MNRLQDEKSPYLAMHAGNPVDWYPWCEEAFSAARDQDKPIFLSVGYSSCHWCHVIARESFEDREIASLLNECFISVKVDKEERPDVDAVYMDAVQLSAGSGGWPMTVLMTPDGEPFFAATYLPKESRNGMLGLKDLLTSAAWLWKSDREAALETARDLTRRMRSMADAKPEAAVQSAADLFRRALRAYEAAYDKRWGGFGSAPKFPSAHNLLFLLKLYERTGERDALAMAEGTLEHMFRGGIFDHLGGGFCRYSVDEKWLAPHFEKMLYDNAMLLWAYAEAWRVTKKPLYRAVAERTAGYVLKEMTGAEGGFFCSQDADSQGGEGAFYLFTPEEVCKALGQADGARFCRQYDVTDRGNFEGKSIPNLIGKTDDALAAFLPLCQKLYEYRRDRMPLGLDDKTLTSWNALMITALAAAAGALGEPRYLDAAKRAEAFICKNLTDGSGGLLLRYRDGEAKGAGVLADYACYAMALTELYRASGDRAYLDRAGLCADRMAERFRDPQSGGYYLYSSESEALITRPKETWDAAMPSGNSCAAFALARLAAWTRDARRQEEAKEQLRFLLSEAAAYPTGYGFTLYAAACARDLP